MRLTSTTTRSLPAMISCAAAASSYSSSSSRLVAVKVIPAMHQQRSFSSSQSTADRKPDDPAAVKPGLTKRMVDAGRKALFGKRPERLTYMEHGLLTAQAAERLEEDRRKAAALASVDSTGESLLSPKQSQNTEKDRINKRLLNRKLEKAQKRRDRKRWGGARAKELEHKYSTADFRISPQKLHALAHQINGKPIDHAILQMQFSEKRASKRILSTLALARDHAIAKGMDRSRMMVSEAWIGKGRFLARLEIKGRGRSGIRHHPVSRLSVVLRMRKTDEQIKTERLAKATRIVRSIGHGGTARLYKPENVMKVAWAY